MLRKRQLASPISSRKKNLLITISHSLVEGTFVTAASVLLRLENRAAEFAYWVGKSLRNA